MNMGIDMKIVKKIYYAFLVFAFMWSGVAGAEGEEAQTHAATVQGQQQPSPSQPQMFPQGQADQQQRRPQPGSAAQMPPPPPMGGNNVPPSSPMLSDPAIGDVPQQQRPFAPPPRPQPGAGGIFEEEQPSAPPQQQPTQTQGDNVMLQPQRTKKSGG